MLGLYVCIYIYIFFLLFDTLFIKITQHHSASHIFHSRTSRRSRHRHCGSAGHKLAGFALLLTFAFLHTLSKQQYQPLLRGRRTAAAAGLPRSGLTGLNSSTRGSAKSCRVADQGGAGWRAGAVIYCCTGTPRPPLPPLYVVSCRLKRRNNVKSTGIPRL